MKPQTRAIALLLAGATSAAVLLLKPHQPLALLPILAVLATCLTVRAPVWSQRLVFAALLLVPIPLAGLRNSFVLELGTQVGMYACLALGLNIVVGMAGLLDLGYAGFFGLGAYTWAVFGSAQANAWIAGGHFPLPGWPYFYLFILLAIAVSAGVGVLIGLPALRLRGDYLAVVTLGLGQVIRLLANNLDHPLNITNGPQGISPIERPPVGWLSAALRAMGADVPTPVVYSLFFYGLLLLLAAGVVLVTARLDRTRFGRAWVAIREDEIAAQCAGVSLIRAKMLAFATGAAFSGAMGAVFAAKQLFVSPDSFTFLQSITILVMVLLGGLGSIRGAILGAAAVTLLNIEVLKDLSDALNRLRQSGFVLDVGILRYDFSQLPTQLEPAKYERMVFGLLIVAMMLFRPGGLLPEQRHRLELEDEP